jgi:transposase, IS5 family
MLTRRESGEQDLFRSRLDQIIDMNHELVKLARAIDWQFLKETFGAVYSDKPGQPPLPTLMAGLAILKHTYDLSDQVLCERWVENPYFQYEEFFQHALVFDRSSLTRWRQRMGEEKLRALLQESLAVATRTEAMKRQASRSAAGSAQPGESQRRPATNSSSRLIVCIGPPALRAPGASVPMVAPYATM